MTSRQITISGGTWFHKDRPGNDIVYLTFALGIAALVSALLFRPSADVLVGTLSLVTLVTLSVFFAKSASASVEIDRDLGEVRMARNFHLFTHRRCYPLRAFDRVVVSASDVPVDGGYRIMRFRVVLSGKGRTLEVFSADTESEGKAIQKELSEFLGMTAQG